MKTILFMLLCIVSKFTACANELEQLESKVKQGDLQALYNLGEIYLEGKATKQDTQKAFHYLERAADQGHADAQFLLGSIYAVPEVAGLDSQLKDYQKAKHYFELAAKQDHASSISVLGNLYTEGMGVEKDLDKARKYHRLACDKGAIFCLDDLDVRK